MEEWRHPKDDALHDVNLTGDVLGETPKAWFFRVDTMDFAPCKSCMIWVPKSAVVWNAKRKTMTIPEWLAKAKNLIC